MNLTLLAGGCPKNSVKDLWRQVVNKVQSTRWSRESNRRFSTWADCASCSGVFSKLSILQQVFHTVCLLVIHHNHFQLYMPRVVTRLNCFCLVYSTQTNEFLRNCCAKNVLTCIYSGFSRWQSYCTIRSTAGQFSQEMYGHTKYRVVWSCCTPEFPSWLYWVMFGVKFNLQTLFDNCPFTDTKSIRSQVNSGQTRIPVKCLSSHLV